MTNLTDHFDYVIVGGGSAGCVLASRLSEDAAMRICLIESGPSDWSPLVHIPLGVAAMLPSGHMNWQFESEPQPGLNGRRSYQPRGRVLGGSSAINGMVYARGHRWDYDHWAEMGCTGWAYDDVLPYFRKAENNEAFDDEFHGQGGPLNVSSANAPAKPTMAFLAAVDAMQLPRTSDFNGERQEGFCLLQRTIKDGRRHSAARAYLGDIRDRKNLCILSNAHVERVLLESRRAVGVTLRRAGRLQAVRATREVVLSAGAYQSPQILMLSGVGPGAQLKRHGIEVVHDLGGVGDNLHDHIDYCAPFLSNSRELVGISLRGLAFAASEALRYALTRKGLLASNLAEAGGFLSTRPGLPAPDIQYHFIAAMLEDHMRKLRWGHGFSIHTNVCRPKSRGSVRLKSADPADRPLIDLGFLTHDDDIATLLSGFKLIRQVADTPPLRDYVLRDLYTHGVHDDDQLKAVLRDKAETAYHPVGTCRMGADDQAVVDAHLRVRGIASLRVVDASVMPKIPGGNTNAPTIMIAEKASDLIRAGAV